jgi:YD repeat-containing protein
MPTTRYIWDPVSDNLLMELDGNGDTIATYTHEPGLHGELISQHRNGQTYYYHYDGDGNTRAVTDQNGNIVETATYSAFGDTVEKSSSITNPFGFRGALGYYANPATNDYYVPAINQDYVPANGRFLSMNIAGEGAGIAGANFSSSDIAYCESQLIKIWQVWKWTNPCAASMLRGFLFGKPDPCTAECKNALSQRGFDFVESCIKSQVEGPLAGLVGGGLGVCGKTNRYQFNLFGSHHFQGTGLDDWLKGAIGLEADLGWAFGAIQWDANVSCLAKCGAVQAPLNCCCSCNAQCGYDVTIRDVYDFCSTASKIKYHPTWCGMPAREDRKGNGL